MQTDGIMPRKHWLLMVFLSLLVAFCFQGSRGLYESTEGRYAECAREMIESGNFLEPTLGYRPHWTKPPLTYWAIAGGIKLLGPSEWGVRFYNAVAFFLTVLIVAFAGAALWDQRTAVTAGFIYATSLLPVYGLSAVSTDMLLALWEAVAVLCFIKAYQASSPPRAKKWILAMWVFFGVGFVTKGPPALLPLIPVLAWHFLQREKTRIVYPFGILMFLAVGFSWYIIVSLRHHELLRYFLGQEFVERIASDTFHRNQQWYMPFLIYIPVLSVGAGPWLYFGLKTLKEKRLISPRVLFQYVRAGRRSSLLFLWLMVPLFIFFVSKSRLPLYVLPLYAPIVLIIARGTTLSSSGPRPFRKIALLAVITAVFLTGLKGVSSFIPDKNNMRPLYEACVRAGSKDAVFVLFRRSKLYGLQYYLNGNLKRISDTGQEDWADGSVGETIKKIQHEASRTNYVIISKKENAASLRQLLSSSGLGYKGFDTKFWLVYRVTRDLIGGGATSPPSYRPAASDVQGFRFLAAFAEPH